MHKMDTQNEAMVSMKLPEQISGGLSNTQTQSVEKNKIGVFQRFAFYGCVAFGIAMIVNTQLACDGVWYWYAYLLRSGRHLYSDMRIVFPAWPILQAAGWMSLAGQGWFISKIPAVLELGAFLGGILLLAAENTWSDRQKAVLVFSVFFISVHFEAYRFDDYHVVSGICYLFAMLLLFALEKSSNPRRTMAIAVGLGFLAGLDVTNRITDGAGLFVCALAAIIYLAAKKKFALLAAYCGSAFLTVLAIVVFVDDSLRAYLSSTVLHAAGPKGGAASAMLRPLLLFWNSFRFLCSKKPLTVILLCMIVAAAWALLIAPFSKADGRKASMRACGGIAIIGCAVYLLLPSLRNGNIIVDLSAVLVLSAYGLILWLAFRIARGLALGVSSAGDGFRAIALLLPFALLMAGSMSSGGVHFGLYAPIAMFLLILPHVFPSALAYRPFQSFFLAILALMAISGALVKVRDPASWQSYRTFPMFTDRLLVRHPIYGPMVIDKDLHHFMERTCGIIHSEANSDLLSIPLPYANYYCGIPPWEGFVQTFYDTAGKDVIDELMAKLEKSPPKWILYQRQMDNLMRHELLFNQGKRLPQRDLDEFIVNKLRSGQWIVIDREPYLGDGWILARSR